MQEILQYRQLHNDSNLHALARVMSAIGRGVIMVTGPGVGGGGGGPGMGFVLTVPVIKDLWLADTSTASTPRIHGSS